MLDGNSSNSPRYLIDKILPSHEVHLLGGPSGSGKSTWLFQQLRSNWALGRKILGYDVHPVPFGYVSADRSEAGTLRTFERLQINPQSMPNLSLTSRRARSAGLRDHKKLLQWFKETVPHVKLIVVDGFMGIVPPRRDRNTDGGFSHIADFLTELQCDLTEQDLTLIGIVHSPKAKEDGRYGNPRERIMGSAAWAAHSETIIMLEPTDPSDPKMSDRRTLILCPRNARVQYQDLVFDEDGALVEVSEDLESAICEGYIARLGIGQEFTTEEAMHSMINESKVSRATAFRALQKWVEVGQVERIRRGLYRKCLSRKGPAN